MLSAQTATVDQSAHGPLFKFYVWGQIGHAGVVMLSANPDILDVLSAAGGPTEKADLSRIVIVRGIDKRRRTINLLWMLNGGQTVTLSPEDIVIVPEALWYGFQDRFQSVITLVTDVATFVSLYLTIVEVTKLSHTQTLGSRR
jgi:protein involved in polysaccharide export with SLBB domain